MKLIGTLTALILIVACDEAYADGHHPSAGLDGMTLYTCDKENPPTDVTGGVARDVWHATL